MGTSGVCRDFTDTSSTVFVGSILRVCQVSTFPVGFRVEGVGPKQ